MVLELTALPIEAEIPKERMDLLCKIVDHMALQRMCCERSDLVFICTHNSRRSHLAQIWASVAAHYYDIKDVYCWSGGTEKTAVNPRVIASLERSGFKVSSTDNGDNPEYTIRFGEDTPEITCFSKVWNDKGNPQEDMATIMVCDHAEQNCPLIPNALVRISLPYVDPKEADGTDQEAETYDKRSRQIAEEMFWIFRQMKHD